LKDSREADAVTLVGRLFHACAMVTWNDRSPMVLSLVRETVRRGQEPDFPVTEPTVSNHWRALKALKILILCSSTSRLLREASLLHQCQYPNMSQL